MPVYFRVALLCAAVLLVGRPAAAQQSCFFSIVPASANFDSRGGNGLITMTASAGSCARTVTSNVSWITVSYGQSGTGDGTAGYEVRANNTPVERTGTISAAGQTLTVTQAAGSCTVQMNPTRATAPPAGGSGSFTVTTDCNWTAVTNTPWLSLSGASGSASGSVRWTAAANTTNSQRTGTITIGSASFTVVQDAPCVFTATATTTNFTGAAGTGTITVQGSSACDRTATASANWITITSGASGQGNGTVAFSVAANTSGAYRVGTITINDIVISIAQAVSNCTLLLSPTRAAGVLSGGAGTFAVTSSCAWTAVSKSEWVRLTGTTNGSGSGVVAYEYGGNGSAIARGGFIQVNDATFVIDQPGASCEVDLRPESATFDAPGGSGTIALGAIADCSWKAESTVDWITITGGASGTGGGTVGYRVAVNPTAVLRTGTLTIGNKAFQVRQAAANCNVSLAASTMQVPAEGDTRALPVTANCAWVAQSSAQWIRITSASSGSANANVTFAVSPNSGAEERTGTVTVNGQTLTVVQAAQRCSLTLSGADASLPARGGSGAVTVTGNTSCNWSATSTADWLSVEWSSVSGTGVVRYQAPANASGTERTAFLRVSGQTVTVRQAPLVLTLAAEGIVSAATFAGGAVAPGQIVTIYGSGFGPAVLARMQLDAAGQGITNTIGDTQVLFDGVAAPMVYALEGQISAIVPYSVAGKQSTAVEVRYFGARSSAVTVPVVAALPGIFTLAASGRGQAAVLNQDGTLNGADIPAAPGSILQIFTTGEGQTRPGGMDGRLAAGSPQLPAPVLPVRVLIGGMEAEVLYAGAAPGLVAGVMQVNARVPRTTAAGMDVPVVLRVGEAESRPGPTVVVR